jgi:phosphoglycolate phosphatase-like HAD superfamily hydrolase
VKRLLLFDIDGTLVWGGPAKKAFETAMEEVFGTAGPIEGHDFSGKTDPQIARELLRLAGLDDGEIDARLQELWEEYLGRLEAGLPGTPMTVLPGVRPLLEELVGMDGVAMGLLTGNILEGARLKLGSVDLMDYFPVGGFGSDSEVREDLTSLAIRRAAGEWGVDFPVSEVVVIGDTPRDVACGKHEGTRTVAVATGRWSAGHLSEAGADQVLADLGDLRESLQALLG